VIVLEPSHIYAAPRSVRIDECAFYHVIDMPGVGRVGGHWDLRGRVDEYLGGVDLNGKRILEIGPASGFLTVEMERRGADVVAVELADDPGWEYVPYSSGVFDAYKRQRSANMPRLKNSFWFTHRAHASRARLYYGDAENLPAALGNFDVAVMAAVLLHVRHPLSIVESCANIADTLVITEIFHPDLHGPACRLHPTRENEAFDTWWNFSPEFFTRFIEILGFGSHVVTRHTQRHYSGLFEFFTIVANRNAPRNGT
jgi:SAM-dependent methyltransferase